MTRRLRLLLPLLVVASGVLVAALIVAARPEVERQQVEVPPPLVRVLSVRHQDLALSVRSQGTVRPRTESVLVAQVGGRIEAVVRGFADGGFFRKDDVLVRIDPRDYELAVSQAEAALAQARVRLDLERAEAEMARKDWQELGEGEPTALTLREPQLAEAEAALQGARAALEQARLNLERTTVRAPFDGRVREKRVDLGQFVAPGTPLASVYSVDSAEVRLPVARDDLAFLEIDLGAGGSASGPSVTLYGELGGELHSWPARIVRSGSGFDPKTRMLPLYAEVDDPFALAPANDRHPLPMGLFVEAEIGGRLARGVAVIPRSALRPDGRVLVVDAEDRLRFREVEPLRLERDRAILAAGVQDGERICASPLDAVVDGMRVRTLEEPAAGWSSGDGGEGV